MSIHDPLDFLREEARAERAAIDLSPDVDQVLARVAAANTPRRRRLRRRFLGVILGALGAGGGGIAWAVVVHHSPPDAPAGVACYQFADLESSIVVKQANGSDPIGLCRNAWARPVPAGQAPPPLVMCYNPAGAIAVFPGDRTTCDALGLTPVDDPYAPDDLKLIDFENSLVDKVLSLGCAPGDQIKGVVDSELAAFGYSDWSVDVQRTSDPGRPCGSLSLDAAAKHISIIPIADMFTATSAGG